tara:strand:- start:1385 stop:1735 length:351 start_codon:yes stop_codon:yes gene_type:complete
MIDINALRKKEKSFRPEDLEAVDKAAEAQGFVSREATAQVDGRLDGRRKKKGRTRQIHTWVRPETADGLAAAKERTGYTISQLIEMAWSAFEPQVDALVDARDAALMEAQGRRRRD